jgi:carbohydrate kinase (thermoresistant glucokinase family)
MASGTPLDDDDRAPWLDAVAARLGDHAEHPVVMACSALRRRYRNRLRGCAPDTFFVHLSGSEELLAGRLGQREGHFMPPGLLSSQLATLEFLEPDEAGVTVDVSLPIDQIVHRAVRALT